MRWIKPPRTALRPFYLYRTDDVSGVSGTGVVAVGVILPSGKAVLEWCSRMPTITIYSSIEQIVRIHGHGGRTMIHPGLPESAGAAKAFPEMRKLFPQWIIRHLGTKTPVAPSPKAQLPEDPHRGDWSLQGESLRSYLSQSRWAAGMRATQGNVFPRP